MIAHKRNNVHNGRKVSLVIIFYFLHCFFLFTLIQYASTLHDGDRNVNERQCDLRVAFRVWPQFCIVVLVIIGLLIDCRPGANEIDRRSADNERLSKNTVWVRLCYS